MKSTYDKIIDYFNNIVHSENLRYVINNILLVLVTVFIVISYILISNIEDVVKRSENTLSVLNAQYGGYVDKDVFCQSIDCTYTTNKDSPLVLHSVTLDTVFKGDIITFNNLHYINGVYYSVYDNEDEYYLNLTPIILDIVYPSIFIMLVSIIMIFRIMSKTLYDKNIESMDVLKNSEYINKYDTLHGLTSNFNHEVSTPLNIINSIFEDFKYINEEFYNYIDIIEKKICRIDPNTASGRKKSDMKSLVIETIKASEENVVLGATAVRQIYDELNAINDYKTISTNESNNIYDLIIMAVKLLNKLSVIDNDDCDVDESFKKYELDPDIHMADMLFVSILINHIKNSSEANANKLYVELVEDGLTIKDNGKGIPENIQKHIFDNDFTTKDTKGTLRGNGLYVNKLLLNNKYDGDITLIESIPNVKTTFYLKIKMKRKQND